MGYKVKVKNSTGDFKNKKCFLGISITNPIYQDDIKVCKIIDWMAENFTGNKVLLIGDILHTFNLNMFVEYKNLNLEEEKVKGKKIIENLISCINDRKDFTIIEWHEIKNKEDVLRKKQKLTQYYFEDSLFKKEIAGIAEAYVNKKTKNGFNLNVDYKDAIDSSVAYLISELSVFSYLIDLGFDVQSYFGTQLPILKKLSLGDFDLNTNLKNCIYVDVSLKKT